MSAMWLNGKTSHHCQTSEPGSLSVGKKVWLYFSNKIKVLIDIRATPVLLFISFLTVFFLLPFNPLLPTSPLQSPHCCPCPWVLFPYCSIPPSNSKIDQAFPCMYCLEEIRWFFPFLSKFSVLLLRFSPSLERFVFSSCPFEARELLRIGVWFVICHGFLWMEL